MSSGPFEVTADQITGLGTGFTGFVNRLLQVEVSAQGFDPTKLSVTSNENAPDGGVDAAFRDCPGSEWVPAGDSAWQFKRNDQSVADCEKEFAKSTGVHAVLKAGGSYVMALGGENLPDPGVQARQSAVMAKAVEMDLVAPGEDGRVRVFDANLIARWATLYPALAVHPILRGRQLGVIDIDRWRDSFVHRYPYSPDEARQAQIDALRDSMLGTGPIDVRLQGESGIGKTRLALEAVDDPRLRHLVAYIDDDSQTGGGLIESLIDQGRHAIVIVDECPAERHVKLAAKLTSNPGIRLVTIGDVGSSRSSGPILGLQALGRDAMECLIESGFPGLGDVARRFVVDHSNGAPGFAIWLAGAVERTPDAQAADMIGRDDIEQFITEYLPDGKDFFSSAVLALFERVGWDRELRAEMEVLANFAGVSITELDATLNELHRNGLVRVQGRYRGVDPLPVAIYLAAEAWRHYGKRIIDDLFPVLSDGMALALFRRLAQLGRFEPARSVLPSLLASNGPFGSLRSIEEQGLGGLLTQLAIVLPDETSAHLALMIERATPQELASLSGSRRDLVWTLEKLVWHSRTFAQAANSLLALALVEIENYANNATGTWVSLFGAVLPGTAASASQRSDFLARIATSDSAEVRALAIKAVAQGLTRNEHIGVSGEIQGGVLVEPRGTPPTWLEVGDYRRVLLGVLDDLRDDPVSEIAESATDAILRAMHPLLDDPLVGEDLARILETFSGDALLRLRSEVQRHIRLHSRSEAEDQRTLDALREIDRRLPEADDEEKLSLLLQTRRWDLNDGELDREVTEAVSRLPADSRRGLVRHLDAELPAAWELGRALGAIAGESEELTQELATRFEVNPNGLVGYLSGLSSTGDDAFEKFLKGAGSSGLEVGQLLRIAARAPITDFSRSYLLDGLPRLTVREGVTVMFGWSRNLGASELVDLIGNWLTRISSQDDYNAVVDWLSISNVGEELPAGLEDLIWRVVELRSEYPDVGSEAWDWSELTKLVANEHAMEVLRLLLSLIGSGQVMIHQSDRDAKLVEFCIHRHPEAAWTEIAERLVGPEGWRFEMQLSEWVAQAVPVSVLENWVGNDLERARALAPLVDPGDNEPTPPMILLLERFDGDSRVASSLRATFSSGSWTGPWSARLERQLAQLSDWQRNMQLPLAVREWAKDTAAVLRAELVEVLEREAERGY